MVVVQMERRKNKVNCNFCNFCNFSILGEGRQRLTNLDGYRESNGEKWTDVRNF